MDGVELAGVFDLDAARAAATAQEFSTQAFKGLEELRETVDAATVAVPTVSHGEVGCRLMEMGIDVLVEKPMASTLTEADTLLEAAGRYKRILQVGHVERFNPAVLAVEPVVSRPLFFEVHRLGVFTPRSLDVDVIYDLMIHDLDILLALVKEPVTEVKAVGIPVLTDKVDIAHARLEFAGGAVANVTASRVSTERVRKMRFFQKSEYISLDYGRRDALRIGVKRPGPQPEFGFEKLPAPGVEPLRAELEAFVAAVRTRVAPRTDGAAGRAALELANTVMASIREHAARVQPVALTGVEKTCR
jgi:predicted dehydrogenase